MKKISAAFDGLKFSNATMAYAIEAAAKSKSVLSGVFLDDFLYHSYHLYDMVGSSGVSPIKTKRLNEEDQRVRDHSAEVFEQACREAQINYIIHRDRSFALQELLKETVYSDLLFVNTTETFSHFEDDEPTQFLSELLAGTQCPVVVVPKVYRPVEKIILLYDGKPSSVFAVKMLNYLMPWLKELPTEIVTVVDPQDFNVPEDRLIREFTTCHYPDATYTLLHGNAKEEIVRYLRHTRENALVVAGAYQRSTVSMWFKTSMADVLMKELDVPLFIAHNR